MISVRTRVGRAGFEDHDHHGSRLYRDLAGSTSYLGLVAFGITGRRLSRDDEAVLDDIALASHVPEPRVWPMKIARVAGSLGRALSSFHCASVVLDSDLLGGRVSEDAAAALVELRAYVAERGRVDDETVGAFVDAHERLVGFGVPFRPRDERVVALRRQLAQRQRTAGAFWSLGEVLWRVVKSRRNLEVNIVGAASAVLLDLGFTPPEIAVMTAVLLQPTLLANAFEGAAEPAEVLRLLPPEYVRYVGPPPRRSARAAAEENRAR